MIPAFYFAMTDFATSDLHLFHQNITMASKREILAGFNRPFADVEEMHERIIQDWNAVVGRGDRVFILGDLSFGRAEDTLKVLCKLNGMKWLIRGNHDNHDTVKKYAEGLHVVKDYHEAFITTERHGKQRYAMLHFPMLSWSSQSHGAWHLHGHSHGNLTLPPVLANARIVDVGVDATSKWSGHWGPVSLDDILDHRIAQTGGEVVAVDAHRTAKKG